MKCSMFEPLPLRITMHCSCQLSYAHGDFLLSFKTGKLTDKKKILESYLSDLFVNYSRVIYLIYL